MPVSFERGVESEDERCLFTEAVWSLFCDRRRDEHSRNNAAAGWVDRSETRLVRS